MSATLSLSYRDKVSQLISWAHWFCLANILLGMLIGLRYVVLAKPPESLIGQLFLLNSWAAQFSLLPFVIMLLVLFPLSFILPSSRSMRSIGAVIASLGTILLLIDIDVYANFGVHLSLDMLSILSEPRISERLDSLNMLFVAIPFILLLQLWLARLCWKYLRRLEHTHAGQPLAAFFVICFLSTNLMHAWADASNYSPITQQANNYPLFYPLTAKRFLKEQGLVESTQTALNQSNLRYPLSPLAFAHNNAHHNVLLVVAQGLRWDLLNEHTMPFSWQWTQRTSQFFNHYSSSNAPDLGMFGLLYGLTSNYHKDVQASQTQPVLNALLTKQNYQARAFSSRPLLPILKSTLEEHQLSVNDNDRASLEAWRLWLAEHHDLPWFNLLHLNGVAKFDSGDVKALDTISKDSLKTRYIDAATHFDALFEQIIATLKAQQLDKNTIIIFTADSGMELNDENNNVWGNGSRFSQYQTHVPLAIHWPNRLPTLVNETTSHLDIMPTLAKHAFALQSPLSNISNGQDLFSPRQQAWVLMGTSEEQAVLGKDNITLIDNQGNYQVLDHQFNTLSQSKLDINTMVMVINELRRFYQNTAH